MISDVHDLDTIGNYVNVQKATDAEKGPDVL